jgi:predicted regulator of Ras-like GTPase activity (Roadblock/LC7/MglB family)
MSLVTSLQSILDGLEEAEGIALVGLDGIVVNEVKRAPDIDLSTVAAEYCGLWREMDRVSGGLSFGPTQECVIANDTRTLVFRRVTPEYFLALAVTRDGNTGKGRFLLRYAAPQLAKEL